MSRDPSFRAAPRGGIDPIRSAGDALAVLALAAPHGHDTIIILLDTEHRGSSILIVNGTDDPDAMFHVLDRCLATTRDRPEIASLVLASGRPMGDVEPDDIHRWLEASDQCAAAGLELIEWFVLGRKGPQCPRHLFGEPERWDA
jgi:hypothetical protein